MFAFPVGVVELNIVGRGLLGQSPISRDGKVHYESILTAPVILLKNES